MTPIASVALFQRNGQITFKRARKESSIEVTQARKTAARYWRGNVTAPDRLLSIFTLYVQNGVAHVSERRVGGRYAWIEYPAQVATITQPHLLACIAELGVDPQKAPPPMPDTLEINGLIYRREI